MDENDKKPGPKRKITKRVEKEILSAIGEGQTMVYICGQLDITRMTEWNHRQTHEEYRMLLEQALERRVEIMEDSLYSKGVGGDVNAQKFWLVNRSGKNWKNIQDNRVGGIPGGENIPVQIGVKEILVEIPTSVVQDNDDDDDSDDT